jgi:hypothetical protein
LFEPPPLMGVVLGGGDDATGSLAGWVVAWVRFFTVGARASVGSFTVTAGVAPFFSGFFASRFFVF